MASVTHQYTYPIRPLPVRPNRAQPSKEIQWTSAYDDVFNQYADVDGPEGGTCNPAALANPIAALNDPSPVFTSVYPEPSQHNRLWSANSFDAKDIHQPSPTFSPWLGDEIETNLHHAMRSQPVARFPSHHNDLSMSGLRISYDPTLAPSRVEETASEMYLSRSKRESRTPSIPHRQQRTSSPGTPSPRRRQRRTPSSKGHGRKSSGQQVQSPRATSSSFVNYTASDSEKLLTGVAPSGSSKTKARREREAVEKRRKFSQAALKAVVKAGGDLDELRDAGLLMG